MSSHSSFESRIRTARATPVASSDVSGYVKVEWDATNTQASANLTTAPVFGPVQSGGGTPPTNTSLPSISGTLVPGKTLSRTNGSWTGATTYQNAYQTLPYGTLSARDDNTLSTALKTNYTVEGSVPSNCLQSIMGPLRHFHRGAQT